MAITTSVRRGRWYWNGNILTASAITSGSWNPIEGVFPVTISVTGTFVATVKIYVETASTSPSLNVGDTDDMHPVLQTFTQPGVYILNAPVEWIKASVTAWTSGTINVTVEAADATTQGGGY